MSKTFFYKLFGAGKMPDEFKNGLTHFEEGIKTVVTFRNYRAPGKYFDFKKRWYSGAFGYSKERIIGIVSGGKYIDVTVEDGLYKKLKIQIAEKHISITLHSGDFDKNTSGEIEIKYYVDSPGKFKCISIGDLDRDFGNLLF